MTFDSSQNGFPKLDTPFVQENKAEPSAGRIISIPWYRLLITLWNRTGQSGGIPAEAVQTGVVCEWAGDVGAVPAGYLLCDGATYSVTDFPILFSVLGYKFGGTGESFAVPDKRDKFAVGAGGAYPLASVGGAASVSLTQAMLPDYALAVTDPGHNHTQNAHSHTQDSHNHTQDSHSHFVANDNTGNGNPLTSGRSINAESTFATRPYLLRGSALGGPTVGITDSVAATNQSAVATNQNTVATNQSSVTGITVNLSGGGVPISLLPPYLAMNYIIKT